MCLDASSAQSFEMFVGGAAQTKILGLTGTFSHARDSRHCGHNVRKQILFTYPLFAGTCNQLDRPAIPGHGRKEDQSGARTSLSAPPMQFPPGRKARKNFRTNVQTTNAQRGFWLPNLTEDNFRS